MAFTRDKRAIGQTAGAAFALYLTVAPAVALTIVEPCTGSPSESGMYVTNVQPFGYPGSGFVSGEYNNAVDETPGTEGLDAVVPVPELENFSGYRVMNCASGAFLAVRAPGDGPAMLAASATLRDKIRQQQGFTLEDVKRASHEVYRGRDIFTVSLRETEQACGCREFGG